ncbi:tetratricopeptide (TPR) repeat protein [Azospirillum lipoferum]|uniref:Tetratricopeptide repeat protein n=1 Tax=Azospirillum lipoferum TaxID=193 RepID=A0A5A9GIY2_AZOLI|nr:MULTISPECIES: tetratricopeptide repeat protein [Azospirillum]KAA0593825.1 tetratricopeptide repeat protein [Azospirillum lipoferum]MCP1614110.1 tetratricopeptide (TPR) repeat protein [Azospirillum lipoferum]MDW5536797.1 tetratricopeptide repeat protein [Azospirillum sp. NL1]
MAMATLSEATLLAFDLHAAGRFSEAETLYGRVLEAEPGYPDALHLSGILLGQTGRLEEGLVRIAEAMARRPDSAEYPLNYGNLLRAAGRTAEAMEAYRRAHALGAPQAAEGLADLLLDHGTRCLDGRDPAAAEAAFAEASRLRPGDLRIRTGLADARFDRQSWEAAVAAYRAVLTLSPSSRLVWYNSGVAACNAGRMAEAATAFRCASTLDPDHLDTQEYLVATLFHCDRRAEAASEAGAILTRKAKAAQQGRQDGGTVPVPASMLTSLPASSQESGLDGRTRRIISFSLWGTASLYMQGALENVRLAAEFYPGWTCRIYHDESVPASALGELAGAGAELVAMEPGSGPVHGLFWRFLVSDDPTVSHFLCRDADSRLNSRERAAVDAWLASGLPFHVMRDHIMHTDLMLAGMWGGRAGILPPMAPLVGAAARADGGRLQDQRFLGRVVWPLIEGRCLVHDSAHDGHGLPFPDVPIDARFRFTHVGACVKDA